MTSFIYSMKQQGQKIVVRPAKSHSARSFFKHAAKNGQENRKFNTLHTQPIEPKSMTKPTTERMESRSIRQFSTRVRDVALNPPEELAEQNWKLKGKLNRLAQQLLKEKVKRTQDTRHFLKMQKEVQVQFQDDKYLDVSRNQNKLIEGVKHQYQIMKQKYEDKCREYEQLLRRFEISAGEEYRFECQSLQLQNKKLRQKLEVLLSTQERISEQYHRQVVTQSRQKHSRKQKQQETMLDVLGFSSKFLTMQKQISDHSSKTQTLQLNIISLKSKLQQKNQKINFLDRIIIEKSNENHHLIMNERKTSKQNKYLHANLEQLRRKLEKEEGERRSEVQMVREKERVKYQTQQCIFRRSLKEKDMQIQKLSSELQYVTTLISYIKTGDDNVIETNFNPLSRKVSHKERSEELIFNLEKSLISLEGADVRERVKSFFESGKKEPTNSKIQSNTQTLRKTVLRSQEEGLGHSSSESEPEEEEEGILESRLVKKSYLRHSPNCQKVKPVKTNQLQSFRLSLVYRFIFHRLSPDAAKNYLSFRPSPEDQAGLSKREIRWRGRYITFKEAKDKLLQYPFELQPDQANLLARYMIQDATREDVFFHEENEIERTIAKSILRAFVGEYLIPDERQAQVEIREVLAKSGKNLRSALTSLAPTGEISHFKLIEISTAINIDFSEQAQNYIISQLFMKSPGGLTKLLYDKLFEE